VTTAGHMTHQPIAVLESGLINRRLKLTEFGAIGTYSYFSRTVDYSRELSGKLTLRIWR